MKILSCSILCLSVLSSVFAAPTLLSSSSPFQPESSYPIGTGGENAKAVQRLFNIDGQVQYFAGSNAWWLAHLSNNDDVDKALKQIASTEYKIIRVWSFGDVNTIPAANATDPDKVYFQLLNSTGSYINYGADGLQRLDYVISSAEKYGIKLVLPFVNNWGDYGGFAAYGKAFGSNATTFYTNTAAQGAYRKYITTLVTRYKNSSAIFSWELANEPRCRGCPSSIITNWAASTSEFIKSLDPDHMVTLGDEGWLAPDPTAGYDGSYAYSGIEGVDFLANLKIKTLDYGTFHLYPRSWGYEYSWGNDWIAQHDAIGLSVGKPVILEEYGTPFPGNHTQTEGPWQDAVLKSGLAADQIWQFGSRNLSVPVAKITDWNSIVYEEDEFEVLGTRHAKAMLGKEV